LREIADDRDMTLTNLVSSIDTERRQGNLSSAIRLFVLDHFRNHARRVPAPSARHDLIGLRAASSVLRAD
jgi:predicted DNA-binding ribbon-helix-helix protein